MKYILVLFFTTLLSCSKFQPKKDISIESINVPSPISADKKDAQPIYYSTESANEKLNNVLASVSQNISNNIYSLSNTVPKGTRLRKDKVILFLPQVEKTKNLFIKKNEINIMLEKSEKFASYKLSIHYYDDRSRKKIRNWLLSLKLNEQQLEDHVTNTLVRFSFQSL